MRKNQIIYTDTASNMLEEWLEQNSNNYTLLKMDGDCVEYEVKLEVGVLKIWFSATRQIFGFDKLQGGAKTGNFETVTEQFKNYIRINAVIIPASKVVADTYEKKLKISTVLDNYVGRAETGYTVKFRNVANKRRGIRVKQILNTDNEYLAVYAEYGDDNSYTVLDEQMYVVDENYRVSEKNDLEEKEFNLSDLESECDLAEFDPETGILDYSEGTNLSLSFRQEGDKVYLTSGNSGLMYTKGIEMTSRCLTDLVKEARECDCWEYIPLYDDIKSLLTEDNRLVVDDKEYVVYSSGKDLVILDGGKDVVIDNVSDLELFLQTHQPVEGVIEAEKEQQSTETQGKAEDIEDICIKKILRDGVLKYIRIIIGNSIYDLLPDKAKEHGLDCNRIIEESIIFIKYGMEMTEDEVKRKCFSVVVEDDNKIDEIIASLFG